MFRTELSKNFQTFFLSQIERRQSTKAVKPFKSIPGPRTLPFVGSAYLFTPLGPYSVSRLVNAHDALYRRYGPIVKLHLGIKMILLYNPDDAANLLWNDGKLPQRPLFEALRKYRESKPNVYKRKGLVTENGPDWLVLRKTLNWILNPCNPPRFVIEQSRIAEDFVHYVGRAVNSQGYIEDFLPLVMRYTQEAIGVVCFSKRLGCLDEKSKEAESMVKAVEESLDVMGRTLLGFPWWKFMKTPLYRKLEKSQNYIERIVDHHLSSAFDSLDSDPPTENPFLRHLQAANLDQRDIFLLVNESFQAGIEATASVIAWMLYHLGRNPNAQQKLYEEVLLNSTISYAEFRDEFPYFKACLKEALRLTPTALGSARILSKDVIMSGYHIPANTLMVACHPVMSRLLEYFPNPTEFRPERFLRKEGVRPAFPFATLPFGFGMRMCPGRRLAEQEIKLCLIKILSKYRVEYVGEEAGLIMRLNLTPDRKLRFRFHERP